jgi:hypothetical protein
MKTATARKSSVNATSAAAVPAPSIEAVNAAKEAAALRLSSAEAVHTAATEAAAALRAEATEATEQAAEAKADATDARNDKAAAATAKTEAEETLKKAAGSVEWSQAIAGGEKAKTAETLFALLTGFAIQMARLQGDAGKSSGGRLSGFVNGKLGSLCLTSNKTKAQAAGGVSLEAFNVAMTLHIAETADPAVSALLKLTNVLETRAAYRKAVSKAARAEEKAEAAEAAEKVATAAAVKAEAEAEAAEAEAAEAAKAFEAVSKATEAKAA